MLSAVSRGLAKAVVPRKPASSAGKSARKYTTGWVTGGLKVCQCVIQKCTFPAPITFLANIFAVF